MHLEDKGLQNAIECYFSELAKLFKTPAGFEQQPNYDEFTKCFKQVAPSSKIKKVLNRLSR